MTATTLPENIQNQFAKLNLEITERVRQALKHESIDTAASLLWKAGAGVSSAELYEYRKTLFPPDSLVDPYTAGPPVLRDRSADSLSAAGAELVGRNVPPSGSAETPLGGASYTSPQSVEPLPEPDQSASQLHHLRQRLVQLLAARASTLSPLPGGASSTSPESTETSPGRTSYTSPQSPEPSRSVEPSDVAPTSASAGPSGVSPQSPSPIDDRSTDSPSEPLPSDLRPPTSDSASLLTDLRDLINRFVILPEFAAETLALWVLHTYAFTLREVTTYIGVVSPEKRCGKTTLLELLGSLAHEAIAAANISPSALFRVIEQARPTLIIDEADTFMQARDEMAGILNAGYRKSNSYVVRVSDTKPRRKPKTAREDAGPADGPLATDHRLLMTDFRPPASDLSAPTSDPRLPPSGLVRFSCWCPKVMAAIGRLPDTLADRCIVITMQRKMPGEKCERLRELDPTQYRQRCADFVRHHSHAIARARPDIPSSLNDRAADIWEPLLAIADLAGGQWPALARQAAEKLSASYDDDITLIGYLLQDIRNWLVVQDLDRIFCRDLVEALNPVHDRPWEDLRRGRDINEWWLGHRLSELGIRSRPIRTGDNVAKGYLLADIEPAFRRYVPNVNSNTHNPYQT